MSDDRIRKLESIGFQWISECTLWTGKVNDLWHEQFQELKKYEKTHGNCNVPARHGVLGIWVNTQRTNYRLIKEGKSSAISDDRVCELESIGFCWSCKRQHDNFETYQHTTNDASPNSKSGTYMPQWCIILMLESVYSTPSQPRSLH